MMLMGKLVSHELTPLTQGVQQIYLMYTTLRSVQTQMETGEFYSIRPKDENILSEFKRYENGALQVVLHFMLKQRIVDCFLSFKVRKDHFSLKPVVIDDPQEILDIPLSQFIVYNLPNIDSVAKYVASSLNGGKDKKIGVIARPCDVRAFVELAKRDQVSLDNLFIIGFECVGRIDPKKLKKVVSKAGLDPNTIIDEKITSGILSVKLDNGLTKTFELGKEINVRPYCTQCPEKLPPLADLIFWIDHPLDEKEVIEIGSARGRDLLENAASEVVDVNKLSEEAVNQLKDYISVLEQTALELQEAEFAKLDEMSDEERFDYIISNFEKCIRCMLCIRACPICYCKDCNLIRRRKDLDPILINLTRLSHVGDTCIACGKCSEVCSKDIPLCLLSKRLSAKTKEIFNYTPGHDPERLPPRSWKGMKALVE